MSGQFNGTEIIIQKDDADIVGQGEFTATYGGEPITFENKSAGDWVQRLDGQLSGRELVITGTLTYNSDTVYRAVRAAALSGARSAYTLTFPDGFSATGTFITHGMSDTLPRGGAVTTSITLSSHDEVTYTAAT